MTLAPHTLGTKLKAERERRALTLEQVSASTKIPVTLLEALERDDLSRWPKGLYRRAFFRSYVAAVGLPSEPLLLEFGGLFPNDTSLDQPTSNALPPIAHEERAEDEPLSAVSAGPSSANRGFRSVAMALVEAVVVAAAGGALAWVAGTPLLATIGAAAFVYYPLVRAAAGRGCAPTGILGPAAATGPSRIAAPPARRSLLPLAGTRFAHLYAEFVGRCRPIAARFMTGTTNLVAPAATRAGQLLKVCARATRRAVRIVATHSRQVSSRALHAASQAFWRGVRSAAEYAELLAQRQLNRTRE